MNAVELFHADQRSAKIYYCEKCRIVHRDKESADTCCLPYKCTICEEECERYHTKCRTCQLLERSRKETERFEKAEKVIEWGGPIYSEGRGWRDGYFENLEEFEDWLTCEEEEDHPDRPKYVWTCNEHSFCQLNLAHILENATQDCYEDWDSDSIVGINELEEAIDKFNEANKHHVSWTPNYKKAVLL